MAKFQWFSPSPQQIAEAEELAATLGEEPYWEGDILCIGQPDPVINQPVPEAVTARQARLALLGAGVLGMVKQALASMPGIEGDVARIEWEYAQEIRRDSPLIGALAPALGLTGEQIDDLFRSAESL